MSVSNEAGKWSDRMLRSFRESDLMVMILICRKDLRSVDRATLTQGILGSGGGGGPEELNLHKPLCEDTSWHFGWKILQEGREESEVEDAQLPSDQRPPTAASVRPSVVPRLSLHSTFAHSVVSAKAFARAKLFPEFRDFPRSNFNSLSKLDPSHSLNQGN